MLIGWKCVGSYHKYCILVSGSVLLEEICLYCCTCALEELFCVGQIFLAEGIRISKLFTGY